MKKASLRHAAILILVAAVIHPEPCRSSDTRDIEMTVRQIAPPIIVKEPAAKDEIFFDSYYETNAILQDTRRGAWSELTSLFAYGRGGVRSYLSISEYERFEDTDHTANFGTYVTMKDSYAHLEGGFGWGVNYIYQLQTIAEYGHKLYKGLFWQVGYNYRAYEANDSHMVYPGLIYYFGDSYLSADYGATFVESRDTATFGTVKGNFAITDFLRLWGGAAIGERLYDIYELDARYAYGYILFIGVTVDVYKGIAARVGYTYGTEDPKFIKRGVNFGLQFKF